MKRCLLLCGLLWVGLAGVGADEELEKLAKEVEAAKQRLEESRKKLEALQQQKKIQQKQKQFGLQRWIEQLERRGPEAGYDFEKRTPFDMLIRRSVPASPSKLNKGLVPFPNGPQSNWKKKIFNGHEYYLIPLQHSEEG